MSTIRHKGSKDKLRIKSLKSDFIEYYKQLPHKTLAAASVGRDVDTILRWEKDDEDFAEQVQLAKANWAKAKVKRIRDEKWLLERVLKHEFAQRTELTGEDGGPVVIKLVKYTKDGNNNTIQLPTEGLSTTSP